MKQTLQQLEPIDVPLKNLLAWEGNVRTTQPDKSIRELAADFARYRDGQGDGDPDAPPHRTDDKEVIKAMRGDIAVITVRPDQGNIKK